MTGKPINIKVEASNVIGSVVSKATLLTLADVPAKPFPAPLVDLEKTTTAQIAVTFENSNSANDGGSPITSV